MNALHSEHFSRHVPKYPFEGQTFGNSTFIPIIYYNFSVTRYFSDNCNRDLLPSAEPLEHLRFLGADKKGILFLVFGAPYFKYGQCIITRNYLPYIDLCTCGKDYFLHHVAIAAGPLVMNADNRIVGTELNTCPDDP